MTQEYAKMSAFQSVHATPAPLGGLAAAHARVVVWCTCVHTTGFRLWGHPQFRVALSPKP